MTCNKTSFGSVLVLSLCFSFGVAFTVSTANGTGPISADGTLVYRQWLQENGSRVAEIRCYSDIGGHGGHFQIDNLTNQNRKFRVAIENKEGKVIGRVAHVKARSYSSKQSLHSAGTRNAGIRNVQLRYSAVD